MLYLNAFRSLIPFPLHKRRTVAWSILSNGAVTRYLFTFRRGVDDLFRSGPKPDHCKTELHILKLQSSESRHQRMTVASHRHHRVH